MATKTGKKATTKAQEKEIMAEEGKVLETVENSVAAPAKRGRRPSVKKEEAAVKDVQEKPAKNSKRSETVFVQFAGREIVTEEVMEKARELYISEGHSAASIKSLRLYIKPEEMKAYYVINENSAGCINL